MAISAVPNKTIDARDDLIKLKQQWSRNTLLKSLLCTAALAAGVAAIIFLGSTYLSIGIAVVVISSLAIYHYFKHYRNTKNILNRAAAAITQHSIAYNRL